MKVNNIFLNIQFLVPYTFLWIVVALLVSALLTYWLYKKDKNLSGTPKYVLYILHGLRFSGIFSIALLLLSPLLELNEKIYQKPVIAIAHDNSTSIVLNADSNYYKNTYAKQFSNLINELEGKYELSVYQFGSNISDTISYNYTDKQTDISKVLHAIQTENYNRNLTGIILSTDGIYNTGKNPIAECEQIKSPIIAIALGDTVPQKDVLISTIKHNKIAYLNNQFPVQIHIEANQCNNKTVELGIYENDSLLAKQTIKISADRYYHTIDFKLKASKSGVNKYVVKLSNLPDEISTQNNSSSFFIDILNDRQKILILSDCKHPDIRAIKASIETSQNYEVDIKKTTEFNDTIEKYNLFIAYQLPFEKNTNFALLQSLLKSGKPILFVLGLQTNMVQFNTLNTGVQIETRGNNYNESHGVVDDGFLLFKTPEELPYLLPKLPPLTTHFGTYKFSSGLSVFLNQQIGMVKTTRPLIAFNQINMQKIGFILGENIWLWRMHNYKNNGNTQVFDNLINKVVQYLSVKADKSMFRVFCKNIFYDNESIFFDAELYNSSYELINEQSVNMILTDYQGKEYNYVFSKTGQAYYLDAGQLQAGEYQYKATVSVNGEVYTETGVFSVIPMQIEYAHTLANHQLLAQMAQKTNGQLIKKEDISNLADFFNKSEAFKTVTYLKKSYKDILELKWLLMIFLSIFSIEWILRKRFGSY